MSTVANNVYKFMSASYLAVTLYILIVRQQLENQNYE
jgi:hypothetical protein